MPERLSEHERNFNFSILLDSIKSNSTFGYFLANSTGRMVNCSLDKKMKLSVNASKRTINTLIGILEKNNLHYVFSTPDYWKFCTLHQKVGVCFAEVNEYTYDIFVRVLKNRGELKVIEYDNVVKEAAQVASFSFDKTDDSDHEDTFTSSGYDADDCDDQFTLESYEDLESAERRWYR